MPNGEASQKTGLSTEPPSPPHAPTTNAADQSDRSNVTPSLPRLPASPLKLLQTNANLSPLAPRMFIPVRSGTTTVAAPSTVAPLSPPVLLPSAATDSPPAGDLAQITLSSAAILADTVSPVPTPPRLPEQPRVTSGATPSLPPSPADPPLTRQNASIAVAFSGHHLAAHDVRMRTTRSPTRTALAFSDSNAGSLGTLSPVPGGSADHPAETLVSRASATLPALSVPQIPPLSALAQRSRSPINMPPPSRRGRGSAVVQTVLVPSITPAAPVACNAPWPLADALPASCQPNCQSHPCHPAAASAAQAPATSTSASARPLPHKRSRSSSPPEHMSAGIAAAPGSPGSGASAATPIRIIDDDPDVPQPILRSGTVDEVKGNEGSRSPASKVCLPTRSACANLSIRPLSKLWRCVGSGEFSPSAPSRNRR